MLKYQKIMTICLLVLYGLALAQPILADSWLQNIIPGADSIVPDISHTCPPGATGPCSCKKTGDCELTDFLVVATRLFRLMLGLLGSLALLFFTYGGIIMILSRGSQTMVQRGKSILTQALIGIMIVLGSWLIVNLVIAALTGNKDFVNVGLFGKGDWWNPGTWQQN